ncbi:MULTISPECIES: proline/glycine betaine ABC transporter permease [Cryobacterium]|uniref:ABC transporter permease subunit n=1 Tax=Cryobacterium levicorallinum TaxID=995038 RepID=A0A1I2Z946_9MICO|nr:MULTISPECIES: ABC transporter permease subunit [Cryobacterium]TFB82833.1 ABC transporter permease subunit [Cryobacterium levicorallinum]TFD64066.1 ABC transporter permease subunit [Cryobacterium sp. Hh38]GEP25729.1 glycine/betaine ABC transporter permease [Cryobacterium levicorallinum]SFH34377.1 glycine betaine/proline transport system permease protein [Cryobacterium levicorallinum]
MSVLVRDRATAQPAPFPSPSRTLEPRRRPSRRTILLASAVVVWILGFVFLHGTSTLTLPASELTDLHRSLNQFNVWVAANRADNPVFLYVLTPLRAGVDAVANLFITTFAASSTGLRLPEIGWLGTVGLLGWIALAIGNARVALLTVTILIFFGFQGLFLEATYTFALVVTAVLLTLLVGIPLGVLAGVYGRVAKLITPVLDFMQTLPTFVYLAPLALIFLIGPASAVIATVIYAAPPVIRLTAHGIRGIPENTREASDSLGTTGVQRLLTLQLPMARRTIVMGINQSTMAALSMVTIAALIAAPGLGQVVVRALQSLDVGTAVNAGLSIVLLAIMLDRVTTAASRRAEPGAARNRRVSRRTRYILLGMTLVLALVMVQFSRTMLWAAAFPANLDIGRVIVQAVSSASEWTQANLSLFTVSFREAVTTGILNPFQSLLTETPFYILVAAIALAAYALGGWKLSALTTACLGVIIYLGLWSDSMVTLAATLVATTVVMVLGIVFGVAMGRSARVDQIMRPMLDAGQTMPAFVYLVPFLGLFGATRFTAIIAGIIYAAPVAIKITADGIAAISPTVVEAAVSSGSTPWQVITKVQLPMARQTLALAANQGLIYVLAMVVVGALVGAGGLGYDVVAGFVQSSLFGKGLAAGLAIVFLGILLDRMTQAAAATPARKIPSPKTSTT